MYKKNLSPLITLYSCETESVTLTDGLFPDSDYTSQFCGQAKSKFALETCSNELRIDLKTSNQIDKTNLFYCCNVTEFKAGLVQVPSCGNKLASYVDIF